MTATRARWLLGTRITLPDYRLPNWAGRSRPTSPVSLRATELTVGATVAQWALAVIAALALWSATFGVALSSLSEHHLQHNLYATFRQQLADGVAPVGGSMTEGAPVALLQAASGGLNGVVIVEGTTSRDLRAGPGHSPGTVLPGQPGVAVVLGRSVSFGAPFAKITALRPGDAIVATTGQGRFTYVVEDVRGPGDRTPSPLAAGGGQLTLVTSAGAGWRSGWAPTHAVFVDAVLKGPAVSAASTLGLAKPADGVMASDTSGLYELILWLQLLAVVVVVVVVARHRWGVWQVWLVGTPVLLASLWGLTASVWPLLPNLI